MKGFAFYAWRVRLRRGVSMLLAAAFVGLLIVVVPVPPSASALDGNDFDPGYIISDSQFYDSDALSESQIQTFLDAKGPVSCNTPAHPGYTCLYDLSFPTFTKVANPMCGQYTGAASETVARIISKVSAACGISPKVLLVMLQKEQGLITDTWPTTSQLATAMGAGCPDTAACDPAQKGFFQQVYLAAYYMIRYGMPPGTGPGTPYTSDYGSRYPLGQPSQVLYQANKPECGSRTVVVRNQPTASLYWYTPYTPNAAALANLNGLGDGCSAYGNRNFWVYFNNWFGNPTTITPSASVSRIGGADRYSTSAQLSSTSFNPGVGAIFIARGDYFADALSASSAAVKLGGPVLLVPQGTVPADVSAEISRLAPQRIFIVGDQLAISDDVARQLGASARLASDKVTRVGGEDRFATSRAVVASSFTSSSLAYVATGLGFADALTASAAAGHQGAPVILVNGASSSIDQATVDLLRSMGVTRVVVPGSSSTVSEGVVTSLRAVAGVTSVERLDGRDRFDTAAKINSPAFTSSDTVYLAEAFNFPDALSGATVAGAKGAPLFLAPQYCVHRSVAQAIIDLRATKVVILGRSLGTPVEQFVNCD
jgi:putative cell wall-binding protein